MTKAPLSSTSAEPDDDRIPAEGAADLQSATAFIRSLKPADIQGGDWFRRLLTQLVNAYDRNGRAAYFQRKYLGLPPDDVADALVRTAVRVAAITGGAAGTAATAGQFAAVPTAGAGLAVMTGAIGTEMIALTTIQMRLVLDLATVYNQPFDAEDPEDVLVVFGYALGAAPVEAFGRVAKHAAAHGTRTTVRRVVSKGTLKAVQDFGRLLGVKILQRTIIKYSVPVASAAIGSGYNYAATKSFGSIARTHMRNRGRAASELRSIARTGAAAVGLALPAAMLVIAHSDGELRPAEKELYRAMLAHVEQDDDTVEAFERLVHDRTALLEALASIEGAEARAGVVEALALMAAYDGQPNETELTFLAAIANHLDVALDLDAVAQTAATYRAAAGESVAARAKAGAERLAKGAGAAGRQAGAAGRQAGAGLSKAGAAAGDAARRAIQDIGRRRLGRRGTEGAGTDEAVDSEPEARSAG